MKPRILTTEAGRFPAVAQAKLETLGDVVAVGSDRAQLLAQVKDADLLVTGIGTHVIDREVIEAGIRLRVVATQTTGVDHIDAAAAAKSGIRIVSLRGQTAFLSRVTATAELTWMLYLALARRFPAAYSDVLRGNWDRHAFVGREVSEHTLGIVGYGRLGRIVAEYGRAFRMRVLATDILPVDVAPGVKLVSLDTLLAESDCVSLHVPLNDSTQGWFGARQFAQMRAGAIFLNTARGPIVDELALLAALQSGHLAGAGLDVVCGETSGLPDWWEKSPLLAYAREHSNLIVTPHVGGATSDSMEKTALFLVDMIAAEMRALGLLS